MTLRNKSGSYGGGQKCLSSAICIGNGQADIATHITVEVAQTLSTMHDQLIVVIFDDISEDSRDTESGGTSGELQRTGCLQRHVGDE